MHCILWFGLVWFDLISIKMDKLPNSRPERQNACDPAADLLGQSQNPPVNIIILNLDKFFTDVEKDLVLYPRPRCLERQNGVTTFQ